MKIEKPDVMSDEQFLEWCGSHRVIGCGGSREIEGVDRLVNICEDCRAQAQRDADVAYYEPIIQKARQEGYKQGMEKRPLISRK